MVLKTNYKIFLKELILTIIGAFIMAIGIALFLLPNQLSSGGVSGIATLIYYLAGIPMGKMILIINIPLFLFAIYKLGIAFFTKSLIGTASLSFFIDILDKIEPVTQDSLLAAIYGGILIGLGTAIIFKANSSTGGTDLFSQIVRSYNSNARMGSIVVIIDFIVVGLNVFFLKEIQIALYSAIAIFLVGKVIDIFFEGIYFTKLLFIVSNKTEEISKEIMNQMKRGVTGLYGRGMYTNDDKLVLMCAVSRGDIASVKEIAKKIDSKCFIIVTNSREVLGEGFKKE